VVRHRAHPRRLPGDALLYGTFGVAYGRVNDSTRTTVAGIGSDRKLQGR